MRILTGGYTADMDGNATGVGMLVAGAADDALAGGQLGFAGDAAGCGGSPSWVAAHPARDVVYAALEGAGAVQAFARTGEATFTSLGPAAPTGELNCHVVVAPDASMLVASCWGDGRVVRVPLDASGRPQAPVVLAAAADPYAAVTNAPARTGDIDLAAAARALREAAGEEYAHLIPGHDEDVPEAPTEASEVRPSRAHQAAFLPGGMYATTDMGLDLVRFWTPAGRVPRQEVVLPRGSGPRHMRWHPSGHLYVVTELSHELFVLAPDASGTWRVVGGAQLAAGLGLGDYTAELATSRDGHTLYAGVRGSNTIAVLRVRGDGSAVEPVALVDAEVDWPRHHVVVHDTLLVAGQLSDEVASFALHPRTGVPGAVRHRSTVPSPTCLLPLR